LVLAKRPLTAGYPTHAVAWEANLYAIDAADGTHLWRTSVEDDPSGTAHAPVVAGDVAYVQWGGGITAVSLAAERADPLWRFLPAPPPTSPQAAMSGAAVAGGVVYATSMPPTLAARSPSPTARTAPTRTRLLSAPPTAASCGTSRPMAS